MASIDLYVVDDSEFDVVMWVDSALTYGDIPIKSIAELVDKVQQRCANGDRLAELRISGHGNAFGQFVGKDWLSLETLPQHRTHFLRLGTYFGRGGLITLCGCHVGQNGGLLVKLSDLTGVPVQAFTAAQRPVLPGDEGGVTRCFITCSRSGPTGSDSLDALLGQ